MRNLDSFHRLEADARLVESLTSNVNKSPTDATAETDVSDEHICICSDSQAVLMALCNPRVVSKQIWESIGALNELACHRPVSLTWDLGTSTLGYVINTAGRLKCCRKRC